jgi:signal transduction histidine kinase
VNPFSRFPLSELVQEAIESTWGTIDSHDIDLKVESAMPFLYGDRQRLREVFENLIDNAAKYMGDQPNPCIEIGIQNGREPVFFVRDNGMGIESQYFDRIFGLFDKLDSKSEGTGIGLALVKRIIETHGGKIWVESQGHGKGSTFYFTIPSRRESQHPGSAQVE